MNDQNLLEDQPIAWTPTPDVIERSQLTKFMRQVGVSTWDELYAFSIKDVERFTEEVIKFLDIKFDPPYEKLLDTTDGIEFPNWLNGAGLNITEMCLDRWQTDEMKDQPAVIWEGETADSNTLTHGDLLKNVDICVRTLSLLGIKKGDAVGIHLPMIVETVVALMAINRLGGIAVPVFSGYGIDAITSRMDAVKAKALFTCYGTTRRGKAVDMLTVASRAVANVPSIEGVIVVGIGGEPLHTNFVDETTDEIRTARIDRFYEQLKYLENEAFSGKKVHRWGVGYNFLEEFYDVLPAEKTSAEDPLIILYTSGTTGKPKGIAHTHASFPIKAAQDMAFGTDVGKGTRISWYTDIGWMMGPWLIYGALINGATICIYDGAPDYPQPDRMWEFCAKHKVEVLGISPTLIRSLAASDDNSGSPPYEGGVAPASGDGVVLSSSIESTSVEPQQENHPVGETPTPLLRKEGSKKMPFERHDLSALRIFASTGEPWNPAPWWWLFEKVGDSKLPIINYSGGTEISGGILMGNPLLPIKPCSFPAPCLGMDVDILDDDGQPVEPGKVGELVIKQPWIGMARGFWQEKERYLDTYWRRFKSPKPAMPK
ncbi:MAG: AMP-binding protein [Chloracidobacterium sp.]|nr:AMP-binding protein [Chloracidobacterium sp.]